MLVLFHVQFLGHHKNDVIKSNVHRGENNKVTLEWRKILLWTGVLKAMHSLCFCAFLMLLCAKTGNTKTEISKRFFV